MARMLAVCKRTKSRIGAFANQSEAATVDRRPSPVVATQYVAMDLGPSYDLAIIQPRMPGCSHLLDARTGAKVVSACADRKLDLVYFLRPEEKW